MALTPPLHPGELHVWHLIADEASIAPVTSLLDAGERARADRFVFPGDRRLFIGARGWLRSLLGSYLGRSAESLRFALNPFGKPRLADGDPALHFNVSHSGSRVVLAFAVDREIGVDIERVAEKPDVLDLAPTVFTPAERSLLDAAGTSDRLPMFFRLWTGKESVLKAAGGGLSIPLQSFSVTPINDLAISGVMMLEPSLPPLSVQWLGAPPGYAAAVAAQGPPWRLRVFNLGDHT